MNKIEPRTLSGFMELTPEDQVLFDNMLDIIKDTYKKYGFWQLDTPIVEYSDVLLAKAGGETEKQIYRFNKGDNDLSLRFDLTVPLAKYVAQKYSNLSFPFKRYQIGKVYRGERPQKGRFREFYQCDIDVIGDGELSIAYDAEMPAIISDVFNKMNIGKFIIRINNRKILNGFFEALEIKDLSVEILRIIDKIDKIGLNEIKRMLNDINISKEKIDKIIDFMNIKGTNEEIINSLENIGITNDNFIKGIEELKLVIKYLKEMNIDMDLYKIDLTIARGLDYYTGTVYETNLVDYPSLGSICSGGRYDNLAEYYTDVKLPGVGISIGFTRLFYQLMEIGIIKSDNPGCADVMILPMIENEYVKIFDIAKRLRNIDISVSICYSDKKFKSKMKYANNCNVKYIIIIGEDEIKDNYVTIKNMLDGNQNQVQLNKIEEFFLNK